MKFGSKLESFIVPEWSNKYVRYKYLARMLKVMRKYITLNGNRLNDEEYKLNAEIFMIDESVGDSVAVVIHSDDEFKNLDGDCGEDIEQVPISHTISSSSCFTEIPAEYLRSSSFTTSEQNPGRSESRTSEISNKICEIKEDTVDVLSSISDESALSGVLSPIPNDSCNLTQNMSCVSLIDPGDFNSQELSKVTLDDKSGFADSSGTISRTVREVKKGPPTLVDLPGFVVPLPTRTARDSRSRSSSRKKFNYLAREDNISTDLNIGSTYSDPIQDLSDHKIRDVLKMVGDKYEERGHLDFNKLSKSDVRSIISPAIQAVSNKSHGTGKRLSLISKTHRSTEKDTQHNSNLASLDVKNTSSGRSVRQRVQLRTLRRDAVPPAQRPRLFTHVNHPFNAINDISNIYSVSLFNKHLRQDIRTVITHYTTEMDYITVLIEYMKKDIKKNDNKLDESYKKLIHKACTALWDSCDKLKSYLNVNILAVYKLLKKKDKLLGTNEITGVYPSYKAVLLSIDKHKFVCDCILNLYKLVSKTNDEDFGKLKQHVENTLNARTKHSHYLSYALGLCTMLFAISTFLCSYDFGVDVNVKPILSQIPIYRFFLIFSLIWYSFGWCQHYLEAHGVNYQFLFGLSNKYSMADHDFYMFGAMQSLVCLITFCLFLMDCKLSIVGEHKRHFIYPSVLICVEVLILFIPARHFKLKARRRLLAACTRVLLAPLFIGPPVTLNDSMIVDILTSLSRPLTDFAFIFSYFLYCIHNNTHNAHPVVSMWIVPLIMLLPYFLRFCQCLRRYVTEGDLLHLGNILKYLLAIVCVVVSSIKWTKLGLLSTNWALGLVISSYVIATIYNFLWDYFIDWGLSMPPDIFKRRKDRMLYRKRAYYVASLVNLLCRCTWALTTTPFHLIENKELSSHILLFIISIVEIFRRMVWVTFRLESEHLLNSYKYRTALWVPKMYNCKSAIEKELSILNK